MLVGGRPETLVAIQAIRDSPILGHGSYPVDPKYLALKSRIQYEHGYSDSDDPEDIVDPVIPTHSHLTMAWVESGILGAFVGSMFLFWSAERYCSLAPRVHRWRRSIPTFWFGSFGIFSTPHSAA